MKERLSRAEAAQQSRTSMSAETAAYDNSAGSSLLPIQLWLLWHCRPNFCVDLATGQSIDPVIDGAGPSQAKVVEMLKRLIRRRRRRSVEAERRHSTFVSAQTVTMLVNDLVMSAAGPPAAGAAAAAALAAGTGLASPPAAAIAAAEEEEEKGTSEEEYGRPAILEYQPPDPSLLGCLDAVLGEARWHPSLRAFAKQQQGVAAVSVVDFCVEAFAFKAAAQVGNRDTARSLGQRLLSTYLTGGRLVFLPAPRRRECETAFHACIAPQNFDCALLDTRAVLYQHTFLPFVSSSPQGADVMGELAIASCFPYLPIVTAVELMTSGDHIARIVQLQALVRGWLCRLAAGVAERKAARHARWAMEIYNRQNAEEAKAAKALAELQRLAAEAEQQASEEGAALDNIDFFLHAPISVYGYALPPNCDPLAGLGLTGGQQQQQQAEGEGQQQHQQDEEQTASASLQSSDTPTTAGPFSPQQAAAAIHRLVRGHLARRRVAAIADQHWAPAFDAEQGAVYYLNLRTGASQWVLPAYLPSWGISPKLWCAACAAAGSVQVAQAVCADCGEAAYCSACFNSLHAAGSGCEAHTAAPYALGDPVCASCWAKPLPFPRSKMGDTVCSACRSRPLTVLLAIEFESNHK